MGDIDWITDATLSQGSPRASIDEYYPRRLKPSAREDFFHSGGVAFVGDTDGTLVPIAADRLDAMPENIFDWDKLRSIVNAVEAGEKVTLSPGYGHVFVDDDGELSAQVRDGNHRTFGAAIAGGDPVWIYIGDTQRQDINDRTPGSDKLYRAVRRAQREHGAPQLKRAKKKPKPPPELERLEQQQHELREGIAHLERLLLDRYGGPTRHGAYSLEEMKERPGIFWRLRQKELDEDMLEQDEDWDVRRELLQDSLKLSERIIDLRFQKNSEEPFWDTAKQLVERALGVPLRRKLGEGGFGCVYEVDDPSDELPWTPRRVVKITTDNHEIDAVQTLLDKAPALLPRIERVAALNVRRFGSMDTWMIVREPVEPLDQVEHIRRRFPGIAAFIDMEQEEWAWEDDDITPASLIDISREALLSAEDPAEIAFLKALIHFTVSTGRFVADLRLRNMGLTDDGRIVVQDPRL